MRIAFDHQIFGWQNYGGISRYAYELALGLARRGDSPTAVIAPLYVNQYLAGAPAVLRVQGVRMPFVRRAGRIYRAINYVLAWPLMRWFAPDIVHETYYARVGVAPRRAKVVLTVYDMIHERFSTHFSSADPTSREKAAAVARADHVICISEQTRRDLIDVLQVDPAKTSVVYLGFALTGAAADSVVPMEAARPYLLYVGSRGGHKNFEALVRAYAGSPQLMAACDLVCFGGGVLTAREKAVLAELAEHGLVPDRVRLVGGDDALLARYYRGAVAFVYPSLYEGFGIPPLEAMSFDCPVVCSNVSSIPEVVGDAGAMFDPTDVASMRTVMEQVVEDAVLRAALVARGRQRLGLFSWERCARETAQVYQRVLA